jgi:hypothetical protein
MKRLIFSVALFVAAVSASSAQSSSRYFIVRTPPFPGTVLGGPYSDYMSCTKDIHVYQGTDFGHQYSCEIRY